MKNYVSLAAVAAMLVTAIAFAPTAVRAGDMKIDGNLNGCRLSTNLTTCRQTPDTHFGTGTGSGTGNDIGAATIALVVTAAGLGIVAAKRFFRS